jgi:hypothetical protein
MVICCKQSHAYLRPEDFERKGRRNLQAVSFRNNLKRCIMASQTNNNSFIDPVCGMNVKPDKAGAKTNYN